MNIEKIQNYCIKTTRKNLIQKMKDLAEDLSYQAKLLEEDSDYWPNGAGEVQNRGNSIDSLCAVLIAYKNIFRQIEQNK